jgi:RND family efflux transporter MFP subunit
MRKYILIIAVSSAAIISGCGDGKSELETLQDDRKALSTKMTDLQKEIDALDEKIEELDTTVTEEPKKVSSYKVEKEIFEHYFEIQGAVAADKNVLVVPEVGGLIKSLKVKEGQKINKGDVIATFDSKVITDSKDELKEQMAMAKEMWEKQERLLEQGVGTDMAVKQSKSQYLSIKQTLESINNQAGKFVLKAPFSGYVEEVFPVEGQMAGPASPIIRLIDLSLMSVKADIAESYLKGIDLRSKAELFFPALDTTISSLLIKRIGKFVNPVNRTITVEIGIDEPTNNLVPNLMSVVRIRDFVDSNALVLPTSIIRKELEIKYVYVIKGDKAVKTDVVLGKESGGKSIITSGLKKGDVVVNKGLRGLNKNEELIIID